MGITRTLYNTHFQDSECCCFSFSEITKSPKPKQDYLELTEKIQKQEDEILILRTALADVVRRLETLESEKKQKGNSMNSSWNNGKFVLVTINGNHSLKKSTVANY